MLTKWNAPDSFSYNPVENNPFIFAVTQRCDPKDENWECCSDTTPCGIGEGDCDDDSHCAGNLRCGENGDYSDNCSPDSDMDCCSLPWLRILLIWIINLSIDKG